MSLHDIRKRANRWSFSGHFAPDKEQPEKEVYLQVLQDRETLLNLLDAAHFRFERTWAKKEELHFLLSKAIEAGAKNHGELETALRLLVATASILPYRKNKNALAVQSAVEFFLEKHDLKELLLQRQREVEELRARRRKQETEKDREEEGLESKERENEDEQH